MLIVLWTLSLLIVIIDLKSESNWWAALTLFFLGTGPAANLFKANIIPVIAEETPLFIDNALFLNGLIYTLSSFCPPYTLLLYSMAYAGIIEFKSKKQKIISKILLFTPVLLMYVFVPIVPPVPRFQTNFIILSVWTIPYAFLSYILIITAFLREKDKIIKIERLTNIVFVVPAYTILLFSGTVLPIFKHTDNKPLNMGLLIYLIACFSFFALRVGFFGVRINIEKNKSIYEKRLFNSGVSIFNHFIKNEVSKISFCAACLKESSCVKNISSEESIDIIISSSSHLLDMLNKLNFQSQEIILTNEYTRLMDVIDDVILSNTVLIEEKKITVTKKTNQDLSIFCDKIHFRELINNILKNAIESIKDNGNILIFTYYENKYFVIKIIDNGCGISDKDIENVTEPFYSTKRSSQNFGLGLYYCKKVIDRHGGFLEIKSKKDIGSEILVFFPRKKVRKTTLSY